MGHYAGEMGIGPTDKEIALRKRQRSLRNKIDEIEIGKFKVGEVILIMKINGIPKGIFNNDLTTHELNVLESAVKRITES
jgi:hypothetical protein